jgi:hypothetical protein
MYASTWMPNRGPQTMKLSWCSWSRSAAWPEVKTSAIPVASTASVETTSGGARIRISGRGAPCRTYSSSPP